MVRIISSKSNRRIIDPFSLAGPARSVVTARSRSASTVLSVKRTTSVLTILYRSVEGLIRSRERVLVAQGQRMMNLSQGAGAAASRPSIKPLVGLMASPGQALPPIPRKIRLSLSIHNHMAFSTKLIPGLNSWKVVARCSARPHHITRYSRLGLELREIM